MGATWAFWFWLFPLWGRATFPSLHLNPLPQHLGRNICLVAPMGCEYSDVRGAGGEVARSGQPSSPLSFSICAAYRRWHQWAPESRL